MFNKLKNKKGFTLIELIIAMSIISILILFAAPKFMDYVEIAKLTQIKNDTKVAADEMILEKMKNRELLKELNLTDINWGINQYSSNINDFIYLAGEVYDITDFIKHELNIKTTLPGSFIMNEDIEVVYYDENYENQNTEWLATDNDFVFKKDFGGYDVEGEGKGFFLYVGNKRIVEIPQKIQGHRMTSYYRMFWGSNVEKVISKNPNITNMRFMFNGVRSKELDVSKLNTNNVNNMSSMFYNCEAKKINLSSFNTRNVTNMGGMFLNSYATTLDLSSFNTSNVTDMSQMFESSQVRTVDLSHFNTSKVTNMGMMFKESKLTELDLSNFNTSKVTNMYKMFNDSPVTTLDLSKFDTSNVISMSGMFEKAMATDIIFGDNFNTSNVTDMSRMFEASKLTELDLSSFDTSNVEYTNNMFVESLITKGWARTKADADRFNKTVGKPDKLIFEVKKNN